MFAFISRNGSLEPLLEGLLAKNPHGCGFSGFPARIEPGTCRFPIFLLGVALLCTELQ